MNTTYKVVIPAAGTGSRIGPYTKFLNKALISINNKPAICHIIDKFNKNLEIVILLGYRGNELRQVLNAIYTDRQITFIEVDKYDGEGSGLGYSLNCARNELQSPFIFISNDTIINGEQIIDLDPTQAGNWIGYVNTENYDGLDVSSYRTVTVDSGKVTQINPKGLIENNIYIGVCGVKDYISFWSFMESTQAIEAGESIGLKGLNEIRAIDFKDSWYDTGNLDSLDHAKKKLDKNEYNILEKENEAIWFVDDKVIKFSTDQQFIFDRCVRIAQFGQNKDLFPSIIHQDSNLYVYKKEDGKILSDVLTVPIFQDLFETTNEKLWGQKNKTLGNSGLDLYDFYKKKTFDRVNKFFTRFEVVDTEHTTINDIKINRTAADLLNSVDWKFLCEDEYKLSRYHGDFHCENILYTTNKTFKLLDWRQNFCGSQNNGIGDVYYDFAKFLHGLLVPHKSVKNNQFIIKSNTDNQFFIDILRPSRYAEVETEFFEWIDRNGFSIEKTKLLTAIIFLNIAGLHEYPYSLYLFYLGKYLLHKWTISV